MSDYLAKPIDEDTLLIVLSRWLRRADSDARQGEAIAISSASGAAAAPRAAGVEASRHRTAGAATQVVAGNGDVPGLAVEEGTRRLGGNPELYRSLLGQFERQLTAASR